MQLFSTKLFLTHMMHIKYKLDRSEFHGIGLFADQDLKIGQLVYTASPLLDLNLSKEQFESLDETEKQEVRWWGFQIPETKQWHVDFDVSKFINHSDKPTVTQNPNETAAWLVTTRDVAKGEELTQNYLEFESSDDLKKRGIQL